MVASANIKLEGYLDVPASRWSEVLTALESHIEKTRAEAGCIKFNVTPCSEVEYRLLVSELFVDQTSFDAHQTRAGNSDWAKISAGIPRHYEITEVSV